jgi:predicted short-subunit dehydrogenase-like oxidoreductase (DUF2520 family)
VGIASAAAGHDVIGVVPGPSKSLPFGLDAPLLSGSEPLPACDLLIISVRDDLIPEVAGSLEAPDVAIAMHLSGFTSTRALDPLLQQGAATASMHPLQSLLDPQSGAEALRGSFAAVTADGPAATTVSSFVRSIGMRPFMMADEVKPSHHAAAAASSNFVVAALSIASELAARTGVPFEAYASLTRSVVDNAYDLGPDHVLTGPISRGDVGTVTGQLEAAAAVSPDLRARYAAMVEATARLAGCWDQFAEVTEAP